MKITLSKAGKKYGSEWIFRNASFEIGAGEQAAILGTNGSGKSTLLQIMSGDVFLTEGSVEYHTGGLPVRPEYIFRHLSIAAPYMELPEELSLRELLLFHARFKPFLYGITLHDVIKTSGLEQSAEKQIKNFSSGMKQRVKLALAILSGGSLVLLDEPASNLDAAGIDWLRSLIKTYCRTRTLIICSNHQPAEYDLCSRVLEMKDLKLPVKQG